MTHNPILRITSKILIPVILLFGLYVQFHGDYGPGGGFQAGVIFAAAIIVYALIFGLETAQQVCSNRVLDFFIPFGVLLYAGTGVVCMFLGGAFLDYNVLASTPAAGQHIGILLVELGVGITVASVVLRLFYAFAGYRRQQHEAK